MGWGRVILAAAIIACMTLGAQAQTVGVIISGRADQAAAIEAVIARIAADPGNLRAIVGAQVAATPAYRDGIARSAIAAYPGFAGLIAEAAGYAPPAPAPAPAPAPSFAPAIAAAPPPAVIPIPAAPPAIARPDRFGLPYVAALRLGVLGQDIGFIGSSFEDGQAIIMEIQLIAPDLFDIIYAPRPTLGGTVSTAGGTNFLYGGLNWHFEPFEQASTFEPLFFDLFFGFALHDGNSTGTNAVDSKALGCDVLFREALELGVEMLEHYTLSVIVSHMSHGEILCPSGHNRGMDHLGLRLGYEF